MRLAVVALAACAGSKPPPPPPPPTPAPPPVAEPEPPPPAPMEVASATPDQLQWKDVEGSPGMQVASLWGDMDTEPNGFFLKLASGAKSGLHTHTNDFHAVVVGGTVTNAQDGQKRATALPPQSYLYQPGGVAHDTACGKGDCIAYVHFTARSDTQLAQPKKGAKVDPRYVEKRAKDLHWQRLQGVQFAPLWGNADEQPNGMLLKIPAGAAFARVHTAAYRAVVLAGTVNDLPVGSYWMQRGGEQHTTTCKAGGASCVVYVEYTGAFDINPGGTARRAGS